jgi:RNA polymerase sigma-70 factor, ECF subfamily
VGDQRSDEDLLRRALDEPESVPARRAASELLGRYQDRVFCWCLRRVGEPERARDLAQDVLVSAYRHLDSFRGGSRFGTWLFSITRNRCLDAVRRERLLVDDDVALETLTDPGPDPAGEHERRAAEDAALALIRRSLDPFEQEVLWLRCFEALPVEEITQRMGIREASGARGVLQRARRKLRAALAREAGPPSPSREPGREEEPAGDGPLPD